MAGPNLIALSGNTSTIVKPGKTGIFQTGGLELDKINFQISCVRENTEVINRSDNWLKLSFLESLAIKEWKPELNRGLKSCKELALF